MQQRSIKRFTGGWPFVSAILLVAVPFGAPHAEWTTDRPDDAIGLTEAFGLAIAHDARLASVKSAASAERYRVDEAKGRLWPKVSADASYVVSQYERNVVERDPATLEVSRSIQEQEQNSYSWGLTLEQPLWNMELFQRLDYAGQRVVLADAEVQKERQAVAERVAEGYFRILLARHNVALAKAEVESFRARLEQQKRLLEKGLATRSDWLESKVRLEQAESRQIEAHNELDVSQLRLERLVGIPLEGRIPQVKPESTAGFVLEHPSRQWVDEALQFNPDIRIAEESIAVSREETDIARARRYPTLAFQARYSDTNSLDQVIGGEDKRVYVQAQMPIYQGGSLRAGVKAAEETTAGRMESLRDAQREAEVTTRETINQFNSASERVQSLLTSLETGKAVVDEVESAHALGLKDFVEVLDARSRVFEIRRDIAEAQFDQVVAYVRLLSVVGRLSEAELDRLDSRLNLIR